MVGSQMLGSFLKHSRDVTIFIVSCFVMSYEIIFDQFLYAI